MSAGVLRGLQNRSGVFGRRVGSIPTHSRQLFEPNAENRGTILRIFAEINR